MASLSLSGKPTLLLKEEIRKVEDGSDIATKVKVDLHHAEVELDERRQWFRFAMHQSDSEDKVQFRLQIYCNIVCSQFIFFCGFNVVVLVGCSFTK